MSNTRLPLLGRRLIAQRGDIKGCGEDFSGRGIDPIGNPHVAVEAPGFADCPNHACRNGYKLGGHSDVTQS